MPPAEVVFLVDQLLTDPSSQLFAAVTGLGHPWTRDNEIAAATWDLVAALGMRGADRKPPRYPRPAIAQQLRDDQAGRRRAAEAARAAGWSIPDDLITRRSEEG